MGAGGGGEEERKNQLTPKKSFESIFLVFKLGR
jgi:hypothetical protein